MRVGFCCLQANVAQLVAAKSAGHYLVRQCPVPQCPVLQFQRFYRAACTHWRRQLWCTGERAPPFPTIFQFTSFCIKSDSGFCAVVSANNVYSASAAAIVQSRRELCSVYYFVSLYETNNFHAVLCPLEPDPGDATVCTPVPPPDFRSRWFPWPGRIGVGATGHVPPYCPLQRSW